MINTQNILDILNHMAGNTWLIVLLGLIYILILEYKVIRTFITSKKKEIKQLMPLWNRGKYLLLGLTLLFLSWTIVNLVSHQILPENTAIKMNLRGIVGTGGLITTIGLHFSAWTLILSAGGRWMVNLAKLLATVSIFYLIFLGFLGTA